MALAMLKANRVSESLRRGNSTQRAETEIEAPFKPGDSVIASNLNPIGHTRVPRYIRGRCGIIDRDHGIFVFPDTNAASGTEKPQHVYSVRFSARELWGNDAPATDFIYVDLWDDYLSLADD